MDKVLFLIKPDAIDCRYEIAIKKFMENNQFKLENEKKIKLNELQCKILCRPYKDELFFDDMFNLLKNTISIAYIISGENIIERLNKIIGDFDPRQCEDGTLRKTFISSNCLFLNNPIYNSVLFSRNFEEAEREIEIIYGKRSKDVIS